MAQALEFFQLQHLRYIIDDRHTLEFELIGNTMQSYYISWYYKPSCLSASRARTARGLGNLSHVDCKIELLTV